MGILQRVRELLGLGGDYYYDDEEYDEDYLEEEEYDEEPTRSVYRSPFADERPSVRRVERDSDRSRVEVGPAQVQMHIAEPKTFGDAQVIADKFKRGTPVIMNLTLTDPDVAKRLIDFASGLTYGMDGGLQKVADRVFMLTPANVDVSDAQRHDLRARGLFTVDF
ncbi:MAG: hypothetical protein Kow0056_01100 [Coriobacteriia bacterium]